MGGEKPRQQAEGRLAAPVLRHALVTWGRPLPLAGAPWECGAVPRARGPGRRGTGQARRSSPGLSPDPGPRSPAGSSSTQGRAGLPGLGTPGCLPADPRGAPPAPPAPARALPTSRAGAHLKSAPVRQATGTHPRLQRGAQPWDRLLLACKATGSHHAAVGTRGLLPLWTVEFLDGACSQGS